MSDQRLRVLVVDDSVLQQRFLQEILGSEGFEWVFAGDGAAGVDAARQARPDIILMDIEMPVMDGLTAAQHIRADAVTAEVPIIMVTSRADADHMESAFVGGCNDYVTKPVHADELVAKIASLTGWLAGGRA